MRAYGRHWQLVWSSISRSVNFSQSKFSANIPWVTQPRTLCTKHFFLERRCKITHAWFWNTTQFSAPVLKSYHRCIFKQTHFWTIVYMHGANCRMREHFDPLCAKARSLKQSHLFSCRSAANYSTTFPIIVGWLQESTICSRDNTDPI